MSCLCRLHKFLFQIETNMLRCHPPRRRTGTSQLMAQFLSRGTRMGCGWLPQLMDTGGIIAMLFARRAKGGAIGQCYLEPRRSTRRRRDLALGY